MLRLLHEVGKLIETSSPGNGCLSFVALDLKEARRKEAYHVRPDGLDRLGRSDSTVDVLDGGDMDVRNLDLRRGVDQSELLAKRSGHELAWRFTKSQSRSTDTNRSGQMHH